MNGSKNDAKFLDDVRLVKVYMFFLFLNPMANHLYRNSYTLFDL